MPELIIAIRDYAVWLYAVLAVFVLRELVVMWRSGREHDVALFGIERDAATGRAVRSLITIFLLMTIGVGVYLVTNVLAPALPEEEARRAREDAPLLETPPTVMLATDTPTPVPATATRRPPRIVTAPPDPTTVTSPPVSGALCRNPNIEIFSPSAGAVLDAPTDIVATVRFDPAEGRQHWLELGSGASPTEWRALGQRRGDPVERAVLAAWPLDLPPGQYVLRLVLSGPSGEVGPGDACAVPVRVP